MTEEPNGRPAKDRIRVLFVCTLNQWRSPTAETLYRGHPGLDVRSAGIRGGSRRRLSHADVTWADAIFVMELDHKRWIEEQYRGMPLPPIQVLDIRADLHFMDPELQRLLREAIDPEIEALLKAQQ